MRLRGSAIGLRAVFDRLAGREIIEDLLELGGVEIFDIVIAIRVGELEHRRIGAGAHAFHFNPGELAIAGNFAGLANARLADINQIARTAQHAGRGAADLDQMLADRGQVEHGVEGDDLIDADIGHFQPFRDGAQGRFGHPALLLLHNPQQGNDSRSLACFRIFPKPERNFRLTLRVEGEAVWLMFGETAYAHRSISPKTTSSDPMIAETSASIWPLFMKSIAARWAKPGARILTR